MILLDARVTDQIATRRLHIVKYRGSAHGSNEYPFLIDEQGFTVLPITGIDMLYAVTRQIISTGIPSLDAMFAALGACTSMTMRLYADRKGINAERFSIRLSHRRIHAEDCADCDTKDGDIGEDEEKRTEEHVQKLTDRHTHEHDLIQKAKEQELMEV